MKNKNGACTTNSVCFRLMLESIILQLDGKGRKCENVNDFVFLLRQDLDPKQRYVILFEESERFREADSHFMQVFCQLQRLTGLNICCVWESRIQWSRFPPSRNLPTPLILHFPQYSKSEITELLVAKLPGNKSAEFKHDFVALVLSIFHIVARLEISFIHIHLRYFYIYIYWQKIQTIIFSLFWDIENTLECFFFLGRLANCFTSRSSTMQNIADQWTSASARKGVKHFGRVAELP